MTYQEKCYINIGQILKIIDEYQNHNTWLHQKLKVYKKKILGICTYIILFTSKSDTLPLHK